MASHSCKRVRCNVLHRICFFLLAFQFVWIAGVCHAAPILKWKSENLYNEEAEGAQYPDQHSAPAVGSNGEVYVLTSNKARGAGQYWGGTLYALDPDDGSIDWTYYHRAGQKGGGTKSFTTDLPVVGQDGTIYFTYTGNLGNDDWNSTCIAINPSGTLKWTATPGGKGYDLSRYSLALAGDGSPVISSLLWEDNVQAVYSLSPETGETRWTHLAENKHPGWQNAYPCIASDGCVFTVGRWGYTAKIGPDGSGKWVTKTRPNKPAGDYALNSLALGENRTAYAGEHNNLAEGDRNEVYLFALRSDGSIKWKKAFSGARLSGVTSSIAIGPDGTIYAPSQTILYALDPKDGSEEWTYDTSVHGTNRILGAPAVGSDGTIYVSPAGDYGVEPAKLLALNPDGALKWSQDLETTAWSSPIIGPDGTIYVTSFADHVAPTWREIYVYAFDDGLTGPADSPWPMFRQNWRNTGRASVTWISPAQSQGADVEVILVNASTDPITTEALQDQYPKLNERKAEPQMHVVAYNATVDQAQSCAIFYLESDELEGNATTYWLYKLKDEESLAFERYSSHSENRDEGSWWLADNRGNHLSHQVMLEMGEVYRVYFTIKDNGAYDLNPNNGEIEDPIVLVSTTPPDSETGCLMNPSADFRLESLLLLLLGPALWRLRSGLSLRSRNGLPLMLRPGSDRSAPGQRLRECGENSVRNRETPAPPA